MGKVKVKVIGDEQAELEQLEEQKKRREAKAASKSESKEATETTEEEAPEKSNKKSSYAKKNEEKIAAESKRHKQNQTHVAKNTNYPLSNAISTLRKFTASKFDETVELHINVKEKGVSGQVTLPHGTGKKLNIKIATDEIIEEIEKGKIDFDILVAEPSMMPKLAKVARVLGPRGLMPNPKSGTISDKPEETVEKLSQGQVSFKTESGAPIIHMSVGKLSFDDKKIEENISSALTAIGLAQISKVTLKSTMSPAVNIQLN